MEQSVLEAAVKERADLKRAQRSVKEQIWQANKKETEQQKAAQKVWQVAGSLLNTVLIIYVLARYISEPAAKYLITAAKKRQWPEKSEEDVGRMVEDRFAAIEFEELRAITDADNPSDRAAFKTATGFVEEWRLRQWVVELNDKKGVTPPTELVLQQYQQNTADIPEEFRPRPRETSAEPGTRMWAARLRARWGGFMGSLQASEDIPVETMRGKVMPKYTILWSTFRHPNPYHIAVPISVPENGRSIVFFTM